MLDFENTEDFAKKLDREDELGRFREKFHIPKHNGKERIYFCGNSLGLQPKSTLEHINGILEEWSNLAVEAHFDQNSNWIKKHYEIKPHLSELLGSLESEVCPMNNLTSNIHFLLVSFYRPDKRRFKIITEGGAFPSDRYAIQSHLKFHGYDPKDAIIEIHPGKGEFLIRDDEIVHKIQENARDLALVMLGGIQYYTGQFFDIPRISAAAKEAGCMVGFDLAHAIGNVPLQLHDWQVDFATWCSYKYLNAGPGGVSGIFIHEQYANQNNLRRFAGWWGTNEDRRFLMEKFFDPIPGADGWQVSNQNIIALEAHLAGLKIFAEAGLQNIFVKSRTMTAYLEYLINDIPNIRIITPQESSKRGAQLSIYLPQQGKLIFDAITARGVIADWREPNVIRVAPVPLYNRYQEVFQFANILREAVGTLIP